MDLTVLQNDEKTPSFREISLEHAWQYFQLHATQRMSVFNFFVASAGIMFAGLASSIIGDPKEAWLGIILGLLIVLLSFIFYKLDIRVSFLIKHAESALASVELTLQPVAVQLFATEAVRSDEARANRGVLRRMWSYGEAFRAIFLVVALVGAGGTGVSAYRAIKFATFPDQHPRGNCNNAYLVQISAHR